MATLLFVLIVHLNEELKCVFVFREAKAHCNAKNLTELIPNLGALHSVKCNASGSQVSLLVTQVWNSKGDGTNRWCNRHDQGGVRDMIRVV